jgi:hypothetical protein
LISELAKMAIIKNLTFVYSSSSLNRIIIQYNNSSALNIHSCFTNPICRRYCVLKTQNTLLSHILGFKIKGYPKSSLATSNGTTEIVANNYDPSVTPFEGPEGPVVDETNLRTLRPGYLSKNTLTYKGK